MKIKSKSKNKKSKNAQMQESYNPRVQAAILEIVDNQIRDNNPPETKAVFQRLLNKGYSKDTARKKIGGVVAEEIWYVLHDGRPFDEKAYTEKLKSLK